MQIQLKNESHLRVLKILFSIPVDHVTLLILPRRRRKKQYEWEWRTSQRKKRILKRFDPHWSHNRTASNTSLASSSSLFKLFFFLLFTFVTTNSLPLRAVRCTSWGRVVHRGHEQTGSLLLTTAACIPRCLLLRLSEKVKSVNKEENERTEKKGITEVGVFSHVGV